MSSFKYKCQSCGAEYSDEDLDRLRIWKCPKCGGLLRIISSNREWKPRNVKGVHRYLSMLPLLKHTDLSMGEGCTPIVRRVINGLKVFLKLDYLNPSGSFKDRGSVVSVNHALRNKFRILVEDTSGNTGLSLAMYGTAAKISTIIYLPYDAPSSKKKIVKLLGGKTVEAMSREEASLLVKRDVLEKPNVYYVAHTRSPVFVEGVKSLAYELYEYFGSNIDNYTIIVPVASGSLLLGLYWGFADLEEIGCIANIPRLVAVQGAGVSPLYTVIHGGKPVGESKLADALRVSNPPRLQDMVEAIKDTRGDVIAVTDDDIIEGLRTAYKNGFIIEPSSATVFPALDKLYEEGFIDKSDDILLVLTGSGLKVFSNIYEILENRNY